jgi:hypothetical protein
MANRWFFRLARAATLLVIVVLIAAFLLNLALIPRYLAVEAQTWTPNVTWTPEATRAALAQLGWSPLSIVYFLDIGIPLVSGLIYIAVGLVILARKSRDGSGLFFALVFVFSGANTSGMDALVRAFPAFAGLASLWGALSWQLVFLLFYVFPDGRFVPRWTRWLLLGWLGVNVFGGVGQPGNFTLIMFPIVLVFTALGSQVYRYFRYADAVSRQQTKWILFVVLIYVIVLPFMMMPFIAPALFLENGAAGIFWAVVWRAVSGVIGTLLPLGVGIAILRYRLWDIDILIRKTVTYALVVALLAIIYFGSVVLLQQLFASVTGQRSEVITVLSTLAIAALFVPLRNKVQELVDRRFYRNKYDAQQILQGFARMARDETDLGDLTARLVEVVDETMQPRSVSVWLRAGENRAVTVDKE